MSMIVYLIALMAACFIMLHTGVDISDWEYWAVIVCFAVARISGSLGESETK